jgi:dimethylamine monooxygenase subunit A
LRVSAAQCAALLPEGEPLVAETVELAREWRSLSDDAASEIAQAGSPWEQLLALGRAWEQDFLLLRPDVDGRQRLVGGVVCFPSSWTLEEKVGHDVAWIHEVVPGLNEALRGPIDTFLAKLRAGVAFRRHNWGLSRWPQLNQHPALNLPKLAPPLRVEDVWLRLEHQALVALPRAGGVLFGIDVRVHPLADIVAEPEAARRLRHALETMPEPMAQYKNLLAAREELVRLLAA